MARDRNSYVRRRGWPGVLAWAATVAGMLSYLESCAPLRAPEVPTGPHLRVMTYNLYKDSADLDAAIRVIRDARPDVVCFQEASAEWIELLRRELGRDWRYELFNTPAFGYDGMGVLSRYPLRDARVIDKAPGGWFPSLLFTLDSPVGPVQVMNVHLRPPATDSGNKLIGYFTSPARRRQEVEHLAGLLDPRLPRIVLGDFNEGDCGSAVARLRNRAGLTDALPEFDRQSCTWEGTWVGIRLTERPDHVLYSADLHAFSAEVVPEPASDHDPVLAILGPARKPTTSPR